MHPFKRPEFLSSSNIYEVNIRQYTPEGSFNAFIQHLPRLKKMGVEILWLMPIYPIGEINRKGTLGSYYSIKDFQGINPEFGTSSDLKLLVEEVHRLDMKIIFDWIANHAAWDNVWTTTHPDFFKIDSDGKFLSPYDWTDVIQIDHDNHDQQQAMIRAMEFWITEYDIDGFRADLAHLTPLAFWIAARHHIDTLKTDLVWLAETEEVNYHEAFDISYAWKWMHASESFVKGTRNVNELKSELSDEAGLFKNALRMYFTTNHDENSWNGTEFEKYGIYAKAFAVFSCTFKYAVPLIYSGQENPVTKRLKFFEKDLIEWKEDPELNYFYKTLLDFRKRSPVFKDRSDSTFMFTGLDLPILAYKVGTGENNMIVVLNLSGKNIEEGIQVTGTHGSYKNIFTSEVILIKETLPVKLQPGEFIVLEN